MNGEPLPVEHGFPVRMVVPGLYGFVSATKWVVDLEVTRFDDFTAFWTDRGWSARGPVKTQSRVEVPRDGGDVKAGTVRVGGHAWAQHTGIDKVEFRLDGDAWREAELGRVPGNDTWVQWAGTVDVPPGEPHAGGPRDRQVRLHPDGGRAPTWCPTARPAGTHGCPLRRAAG